MGMTDTWNWRRRFARLRDTGRDLEIHYISEKANVEDIIMCSIGKDASIAKVLELPIVTMQTLDLQCACDRWEHEHQYELAVGDELVSSVKTIVDRDGKLPSVLYPFMIMWSDAYEDEQQSVFALISSESRQAWLRCMQMHLPSLALCQNSDCPLHQNHCETSVD